MKQERFELLDARIKELENLLNASAKIKTNTFNSIQRLKQENRQLKEDLQAKGILVNTYMSVVGTLDNAKKLEQSQNQKAIEVLEQLRRDIWTDQQDDGWLDEKVDLYYLSEIIDNKIKELRSEK